MRPKTSRQEMIEDLEEMATVCCSDLSSVKLLTDKTFQHVIKMYTLYRKNIERKRNVNPKRIIFYRGKPSFCLPKAQIYTIGFQMACPRGSSRPSSARSCRSSSPAAASSAWPPARTTRRRRAAPGAAVLVLDCAHCLLSAGVLSSGSCQSNSCGG